MKFRRRLLLLTLPPLLLLFLTGLAPLFAPHDPYTVSLEHLLEGPSLEYPLGTDELGRCIFSRVLYGGRATLGTALVVELSLVITGVVLGTAAGFLGGWADTVIGAAVDTLLAFPSLLLSLAIAGILGPGSHVGAMMVVYWVEHCRIARTMSAALREKEYVKAAWALGCTKMRIVRCHVLPEVLPTMSIFGMLHFTQILTGLSALSFFGLGPRPPTAEWGALLSEQRNLFFANPLASVGILCCLIVSGATFQATGEGLRRAMNPRHSPCL